MCCLNFQKVWLLVWKLCTIVHQIYYLAWTIKLNCHSGVEIKMLQSVFTVWNDSTRVFEFTWSSHQISDFHIYTYIYHVIYWRYQNNRKYNIGICVGNEWNLVFTFGIDFTRIPDWCCFKVTYFHGMPSLNYMLNCIRGWGGGWRVGERNEIHSFSIKITEQATLYPQNTIKKYIYKNTIRMKRCYKGNE